MVVGTVVVVVVDPGWVVEVICWVVVVESAIQAPSPLHPLGHSI